MSQPTWVRGLKRRRCALWMQRRVAPYVGAWIETAYSFEPRSEFKVAPYVGAWIETCAATRLRMFSKVAPYVGAWIETVIFAACEIGATGRTLRGCVD